MIQWQAFVKEVLRRFGYDVVRYPLAPLLRRHGVDVVLDVGAHDGGYGRAIRRLGYDGRIVSFEPLPGAVARLRERTATDARWEIVPVALGAHDGEAVIHEANRAPSSSLLPMLPRHEAAAPGSGYVGETTISVRRLDDLFDDHVRPGERAFLKIDTQGYEAHVLDGAAAVLPRVAGVQIELSLVPLYEGGALLPELVARLQAAGFALMAMDPGFRDPDTGQLLQMDGLFFRTDRDG